MHGLMREGRRKPALYSTLYVETLEHLLAVEREAADLDIRLVTDEFITRDDFRKWLVPMGRSMPAFWYGPNESHAAAQSGKGGLLTLPPHTT